MLAKSEIQREALNLPAQERVELVVELWDRGPAGGAFGALGSGPQARLLRQDVTLPVRLTSAGLLGASEVQGFHGNS